MTFDGGSRFRLTEEAIMAPGRCFVTATDKGPFVDLGRDIQFAETGRAYLSVDVIRELAEGAGLFDEVREQSVPREVEAYQRGYTEGVEARADLDSLADRLDAASRSLRHGRRPSDPILPSGEDDADQLVLVVDGDGSRAQRKRGKGADGHDGAAPGQGDGAGSDDRPAGVPSGSGDVTNPFRV